MTAPPRAAISVDALHDRLAGLPRAMLANLPTPLEHCPRLSAAIGGPDIYMKRDDLTGLALGGNKTRKLEFLLGDAVASGADCVVTGAAAQSNHCRQTAAGCAKLGLECYLVLASSVHNELQGNLLLDHLLGAHVQLVEGVDQVGVQAVGDEVEAALRREGRKPYRINLHYGDAAVLAGAGYLNGVLELEQQVQSLPRRPGTIVTTSGSGGTHAAIALAIKALGLPYRLIGISIRKPADQARLEVAALATRIAERFGIPTSMSPGEVIVLDRYVGEGYGRPTPATVEAIKLVARTEGILLDPVYTGKAMSGLIDLAKKGELEAGEPVVFLHSGGVPAIFAYHQELEP